MQEVCKSAPISGSAVRAWSANATLSRIVQVRELIIRPIIVEDNRLNFIGARAERKGKRLSKRKVRCCAGYLLGLKVRTCCRFDTMAATVDEK